MKKIFHGEIKCLLLECISSIHGKLNDLHLLPQSFFLSRLIKIGYYGGYPNYGGWGKIECTH
jgi:hypothetical protein